MPTTPKPLEHPDDIHLQAAQGWLELGNHVEANEADPRTYERALMTGVQSFLNGSMCLISG